MRILVADDDEDIAWLLQQALTGEQYMVDVVHDGAAALAYVETIPYDLLLLDVILPKIDGFALCRKIRAEGCKAPILLLTGKSSSQDKVLGLDAGADDYVCKPFDWPELSARVRAMLRRGNVVTTPILSWQGLLLDPSTHEVSYCGQSMALTPKEYSLLELFLRNGNRVLNRALILDHLWSYDDPPNEDTVRAHIKGIRHKLKVVGAPTDLIETVYGLGYRLKTLA